jgi:MYXO-CTERM domain-containing protein
MGHTLGLAAAAAVLGFGVTAAAPAAIATFDFENGTDQGFGTGFGDDASATFAIENIGGSNRMRVVNDSDFQEAGRASGNPAEPFYQAMLDASADESAYEISYDWYVDTSGFGQAASPGTFLQVGTYVNAGSGYYAQDWPDAGKDVELNGTQLTSGQVFSGTVTETFAAKGFNLATTETFFRLGLIVNNDGGAVVHFDNISVRPVPEPGALALLAVALPALSRRRRGRTA